MSVFPTGVGMNRSPVILKPFRVCDKFVGSLNFEAIIIPSRKGRGGYGSTVPTFLSQTLPGDTC